jgi:hypothetical protein
MKNDGTLVVDKTSAFKKSTFEDLLRWFSDVRVAFMDHADLVVPDTVRPRPDEGQVLSYGLDMPVPISDLEISDAGISATLSFSRLPHKTFVPWEAVVGLRGYGEKVAVSVRTRPQLKLVP